jgi:hypothetical protein
VLDRRFVPLRGPPLGLLLGKTQRMQHAADVVAVVLHTKPLANDLCYAAASPQVGPKACRQRTGANDLGEFLLLLGRQPGRTTSIRLGGQGLASALGCCAFPTLDARHIDADKSRDLRVALPVP